MKPFWPRVVAVSLVVGAWIGADAAAGYAAGWIEVGDAGSLPSTAQPVVGLADLATIDGTLRQGVDVDMYRICIAGGGNFSAIITAAGQFLDPQLFLFDAAGIGVYANDDTNETLWSALPASTPLTPTEPGAYYLAISSYNSDPESNEGPIFPSFPYTDVVGPTDVGGNAPVVSWTDNSQPESAYTITLTGAMSCPPVPEGRADCRNVGWRQFADVTGVVFRNQGACVSFVVSHRLS